MLDADDLETLVVNFDVTQTDDRTESITYDGVERGFVNA